MGTLTKMQFYKVSKLFKQQVQPTAYLNKNEMQIKNTLDTSVYSLIHFTCKVYYYCLKKAQNDLG